MAHKKAAGSTRNGRDSPGKRLGIKCFSGKNVIPGNIIVKQRGSKVNAGINVGCGKDYTLFSLTKGKIKYRRSGINKKLFVDVLKTN